MGIGVRQLDTFGVEVSGLDLGNISQEEQAQIYRLWLQHGLLLFCNTGYDPALQINLAQCFGPLREVPSTRLVEGEPRLMLLGNEGDDDYLPVHLVDGEPRRGFLYWHCDQTYFPAISRGSLLAMRIAPASGGDTEFADTARAYDDLPDRLKSRIQGLSSVHDAYGTPRRAWGRPGMTISVVPAEHPKSDYGKSPFPPVVQPLVMTHEETGRKSLLLSALNFTRISGLPEDEGEALFEELMAHTISPKYVYRHHWTVGDMLLWDNRRTMHFANGYPPDEERMVTRATLAEGQPTGHYLTE